MRQRIKKLVKRDTVIFMFLKKINAVLEKSALICQNFYIRFLELYYDFNSKRCEESGVYKDKRKEPLIISLTTIPERIDKVHLCIETLLEQTLKPDNIILWIADNISKVQIPDSLERLKRRGLEIKFCEDIRSYKKYFYTLIENPKSIIVTADDDLLYQKDWLERLYVAYEKEPQYIHCHRAHLMEKDVEGKLKSYYDWTWCSPGVTGPSLRLFPTGCAGVLYPPGSLHKEVLNKDVFMRISPHADDVWLKAMSLLNGVQCKKVGSHSMPLYNIRGIKKGLWSINVERQNDTSWYDQQIQAVFSYYGLYQSF